MLFGGLIFLVQFATPFCAIPPLQSSSFSLLTLLSILVRPMIILLCPVMAKIQTKPTMLRSFFLNKCRLRFSNKPNLYQISYKLTCISRNPHFHSSWHVRKEDQPIVNILNFFNHRNNSSLNEYTLRKPQLDFELRFMRRNIKYGGFICNSRFS